MTPTELSRICGFSESVSPMQAKEVTGLFCGDLLSHVLAHIRPGNAWVTVMANRSTLAVASLTGASCVILCDGVRFNEADLKKAVEEEICILVSDAPCFETALQAAKVLNLSSE